MPEEPAAPEMSRSAVSDNHLIAGGRTAGEVAAGIVLYRPDPAILGRLLTALCTSDRRLFVFANEPLTPDVRSLTGACPCLRLIECETNIGLASGLNVVARAAADEGQRHIILFDQDSEPPSDLPERLLDHWRALETHGFRPAAVGPLLPAPEGEGFRSIRYDFREADDPAGMPALAAVEFLPTSGSLIGLEAFAAVGPFRDDFFVDGIDVEWGLRAWACGRPCYLARDVVMPHRWGGEAKAGTPLQIARQAPLRTYYYVRNAAAVMTLPHTPHRWRFKTAARLAAQAAYLVWHGRRGRNLAALARGAADGFAGRLGPAPRSLAGTGPETDAP